MLAPGNSVSEEEERRVRVGVERAFIEVLRKRRNHLKSDCQLNALRKHCVR